MASELTPDQVFKLKLGAVWLRLYLCHLHRGAQAYYRVHCSGNAFAALKCASWDSEPCPLEMAARKLVSLPEELAGYLANMGGYVRFKSSDLEGFLRDRAIDFTLRGVTSVNTYLGEEVPLAFQETPVMTQIWNDLRCLYTHKATELEEGEARDLNQEFLAFISDYLEPI